MVGIDTNSNKCPRSCTCSYTSIFYSDIVTETEFSPNSDWKLGNSESRNTSHNPKCTCPRTRHRAPPVAIISDVRDGPLSTTSCRPLPLPLTPITPRNPFNSGHREPDWLRRQRTLISTYGDKSFVPQEPQRIYYARSNPKHVGEFFTSSFEETVLLKKNEVQKAEFVIVTDSLKTPFQSVLYLKGDRRIEYRPEKADSEVTKVVMESIGTSTTKSVKSSQRLQYFIPAMPCDAVSLLEDVRSDCDSLYRAMGPTASSKSSQSAYCSDNSADMMVKLWNDVCGKDLGRSLVTENSSWEQPLSEEGAFRSGSEDQFTELTGVPSYSVAASSSVGSFTEWGNEISRLREFLKAQRSASTLSCSTAKTIPLPLRGEKRTSPTDPPSILHAPKKAKEWKLGRMATGGKKAIVTWAKNTFGKNKKK